MVGGGIAGLTAALRLSERGYKVTVYEQKAFLGGNLGAHKHPDNNVYHDVYSHMFCSWYHNFWKIVERDLGMKREECFEPRNSLKVLRKNGGGYAELRDFGSFESAWANLRSGLASVPDMFLWAYSMLDLLAQPFHRERLLKHLSVGGFLWQQPYATEASVALHDFIMMVVWSVHSDDVPASSYRKFIKYSFRNPRPPIWLLKGNLYDKLMKPLEAKLKARQCDIRTGMSAWQIVLGGRQVEISLRPATVDPDTKAVVLSQNEERVHADYVILAVPPRALASLVERGAEGSRIIDRVPQLSQVKRLYGQPVPVLDLYFNKKLPNIPKEPVSLWDSGADLTFLDLSQLWVDDPNMRHDGNPITALSVAASDYPALPFEGAPEQTPHELVKRLHEYLPSFNPRSDIDWAKSHFQSNRANDLFINDVGTEEWRPKASYPELPNVFFAGDFCRNAIDMATLEGAVTSGLNAARALWERVKETGQDPGTPIDIIVPDEHPRLLLLWMKLFLAPYAVGAKLWANALDATQGRAPMEAMTDSLRLLWAPYAYVADWLETAYALYEDSFRTVIDRSTRRCRST